ncbi:MAG: DUF177 domain-containing protein [Acidobacteriia bacterium]|nr:DUF177 domain-containing protein [Terriglobia bacterium]
MLITLQELELHRIVVSKTYAPGALDYHGAEYRQGAPLQVNGIAELVGPEIRIRGHLDTRIEALCDRCLRRTEIPIARDFDLFYRSVKTIARVEEIEIPEDELDIGFYEGEGIALADIVREQVILSLPMKIICRPDCRGLCPNCGADLNRGDCGCPPPEANSPFTSLKGG